MQRRPKSDNFWLNTAMLASIDLYINILVNYRMLFDYNNIIIL